MKLLAEGGRVTAATSSQICDGASGVMIASEAGLKAIGAKPLARNEYKLKLIEVAVKRAVLLAAGKKPYWEA